MKGELSLKGSNHDFQKVNLVTMRDKQGTYDIYQCTKCNIQGIRRGFTDTIVATGTRNKFLYCTGAECLEGKKVKILKCMAYGPQFANLEPGTIHTVVQPPGDYKNDSSGVWVDGIGEPVKVLANEFIYV